MNLAKSHRNHRARTNGHKKESISQGSKLLEVFLNNCRKSRIPVTVRLRAFDDDVVSGVIVGFDQECLILEADGTQQLLFKSGLTRVVPQREVEFIFNRPDTDVRGRDRIEG